MQKDLVRNIISTVIVNFLLFTGCTVFSVPTEGIKEVQENFVKPSNAYRPQPLWHMNGVLTKEGIYEQLKDAWQKDGFGGVAVLALTAAPTWDGKGVCPGTSPEFLSESYFDRYLDILNCSEKLGTEVILYDDVDFPSGVLGGRIAKEFPQYTQKRLTKREKEITGPGKVCEAIHEIPTFVGVVAMNVENAHRIDLSEKVEKGVLTWMAPEGKWKIITFFLEENIDSRLDYMDEAAVERFISLTYEQYAARFGRFFGKTIRKTFFDDVGYYDNPRYWNAALTDLFEKRDGKKAILYYPALWYNIGTETEAARVAFYGLRAELIGEGYPKKVSEWSARHNLISMGHPPGNYEPTSVDMYGDPFKYYRYVPVPLMDAIHGYPYGRPGFKLISSAADVYDRPNVAVEIYGNYMAEMDSFMLYRAAMELMVRGANIFLPHGMWYDSDKIKIPPLIAHQSKLLGPTLSSYSDFIGRCSVLLQEGNRVADIAVLYPIESLEGWHQWECSLRPKVGKDVPPGTDYNRISDMLTGQIRKDFTFVHPEELLKDKYKIIDGKLCLSTRVTHQEYKLLIIPSSKVMSLASLNKIKAYYEAGGKIIATHQLPYKSADFGKDDEVVAIIHEIFGVDSSNMSYTGEIKVVNENGGEAIFLPLAEKDALDLAISSLLPDPDVSIEKVAVLDKPDALKLPLLGVDEYRNLPSEKLGMLSYIHKQKLGKEIYFFANSTDHAIRTKVSLKGILFPELWNPYTGQLGKKLDFTHETKNGKEYTSFFLDLSPVESVFILADSIAE